MCGIAGVLHQPATENVKSMIQKLAHRGPDGHDVKELPDASLGHARLAILDIEGGHQPMQFADTWIAFNGEIYNYRALQSAHLSGINLKSRSDTEVLLHLYRGFGPEFVEMLDGMFAFVIYQAGEYLLARDPLGIKPLYYGPGLNNEQLYFASEIKALSDKVSRIREFPPGHWFHSKNGWSNYYQIEKTFQPFQGDEKQVLPLIKSSLREAVHKRLLSDVPIGVSLSGGLDSSIVSALACENINNLHSFAVGMSGSQDLAAARHMSEFLQTQHHELVYTSQEVVNALPEVLYYLETFDPALVRSAIPNFFLAKLASRYVKVFLTGEGADEVYAGYDYLSDYTSPETLQQEMIYITKALHNTNLQRADRMSMAFGLEARVPFLDVKTVSLALSLPPEWKMHDQRVPKQLLRQAFADDLPRDILNRPKQKFSSGAGSSDLVSQLAEAEISDEAFAVESARLKGTWEYSLQNKEALYYYRIMHGMHADEWIFPTMGKSRSL